MVVARGWFAGVVILVLAAVVGVPSGSRPAAASAVLAKKKCHTVTKKVHGKKKKVKVCTTVKPTATPTPTPTATTTPPTLRDISAAHGITVGGLGGKYFIENNQYAALLASQFNGMIIPEFQWSSPDPRDGVPAFRPDPSTYNWGQVDSGLDFARQHHMAVQIADLVSTHYQTVSPTWLPDWLTKGNYTPDQLRQILVNHITTVMQHLKQYSDLKMEIAVVGEPMWDDFWYDHLGEGYIDLAFRTARQAWPQATLYLDDTPNDTPGAAKFAWDLQMVKRLRQETVTADGTVYPLIDEIGIEYTVDAAQPMPPLDQLVAAQKAFMDVGVRPTVTGIQVDISKLTASNREEVQAADFRTLIDAYLKDGYSKTFYLWGLIDGGAYCFPNGSEGCLFDAQYRPKPAFDAMASEIALLPSP